MVVSIFDNNYYWVRNINNKNDAANILAKIKVNMIKLVDYLKNNINN